jgi:hypothetical protein
MSILDVLIQARARISTPDHWMRHHPAADKFGNLVPSNRPEAHRFCALGAIGNALGGCDKPEWEPTVKALHEAKDRLFPKAARISVTGFNDTRNHEDVLAIFDGAIEAERGITAEAA